MGFKTYKATEWWMTAARKLMGFELRVSGAEGLPERPTMFVSNHFTRIETFLTPYALFLHTRRQVRTLGMPSIFRSWFGRYFEQLGGMSLHDPRRNITIIRELMTGQDDWLIYPEGGLVKNKKTVDRGRLKLHRPARIGPPHTGAAMMALKAEIAKHRYLEACGRGDTERRQFYEQRYHLSGSEEIRADGIIIVPVNLTFYPLRPGMNLINRMARRFSRDIDPRLEEELQVEGKILLGGTEIIIHFGEPIEVNEYLDRPTQYARRLVGLFSERRSYNLALRRQARRLTDDSIRSIYTSAEVNFDHLFCAGLYLLDREEIDADDFHRALYLAAHDLSHDDEIRVHPSFHNGVSALTSGLSYDPLDSVVRLVEEAGVARRIGSKYLVNRDALHDEHEFHQIRIRNPIRVIANELEPIRPAMNALRRAVELEPNKLRARTASVLLESDQHRFETEYEQWAKPDLGRAKHFGAPFFLEADGATTGIVLVHGYLGCPEQVRPMAEFLHRHGMSAYGVRLAGHGTSPSQLPHVVWTDWLDSVMHGYATIRQHCDHIVMIGFSFGGILSLLAAAELENRLGGVVSINAPLRLRDRRFPFVPAMVRWNQVLRRLGLGEGRTHRRHHTESPGVNYDHHYLEAVSELRRAVSASRRSLRRVHCPVLVIQSEDDPLVAQSSGRRLLAELRSPLKMLAELPFDRHMIVRGPGSELVYHKVKTFTDQVQPAKAHRDDHAAA